MKIVTKMKRAMTARTAKRAAGGSSHDVEKRVASKGPREPASQILVMTVLVLLFEAIDDGVHDCTKGSRN